MFNFANPKAARRWEQVHEKNEKKQQQQQPPHQPAKEIVRAAVDGLSDAAAHRREEGWVADLWGRGGPVSQVQQASGA